METEGGLSFHLRRNGSSRGNAIKRVSDGEMKDGSQCVEGDNRDSGVAKLLFPLLFLSVPLLTPDRNSPL